MTKEELEALRGVIVEQVKPMQDTLTTVVGDIKKVDETVKGLDGRLKPLEDRLATVDKEVVRYDGKGKRFLFNGEEIGKAPGVISARNTDSKPLMVSKIWRGVMAGGGYNDQAIMKHAPEEYAMSQRLLKLGYTTEHMGSMLFPMGAEFFVDPVDKDGKVAEDWSGLRKEIRERMSIGALYDPGEVAWMAKRHPEIAKAMGLQSKDLALGDDTLGGFLVPDTQAASIIDLLRPRVTVIRAGATEIPLPPSGNIGYPRLISDPSFAYADPDTTTDATTSNIGTGIVRLQAKSLRGFVTIPNDLLRYSSPSVEMVVRQALANRAAVVEDNQFLEGIGSSLAPKGLLSYLFSGQTAEIPAVNKLTTHAAGVVATNGDTFQPEDVLKIVGLYFMGNDPEMPTGWIMRPLMFAAVANRRNDAITAGDGKGSFMFWTTRASLGDKVPEALGGYPVYTTVNSSNNRIKGTGTNLVYIAFGNFTRIIIGRVGTIELAVSEHVKFLQDKVIIRAVERHDMGLQHEESFVITDNLLES
jgi:HK97 family phage major capsid protein